MTIALIAALITVCVARDVFSDRRDRRERAERADLLQRIQAPHAAVVEHHAPYVSEPELDRVEPLSDDELAERRIAEREALSLIEYMEAVENGDVPPNTRVPV